ncbi:MAG: hypothetical protein GXO15_03890 [Crenarchaeota archaeon]|nr:hypothetical protein [Thermoproteota archaeon]
MTALRRLIRLFFNTYYEEDAKRVIEALEREAAPSKVRVTRSRVVPELYYVEIPLAGVESREEAARLAEKLAATARAVSDTVFGVKAYVVGWEDSAG